MQDVSNNLLAGVCCRLVPGKLEAAGAEGRKLEPCRGLWKIRPLTEGEASAGLVGASTVLCDALVDGLVLRGDVGDGKRPAGGDREQRTVEQTAALGFPPPIIITIRFSRISICELHISTGCQQFSILQPDEVRFWDPGCCAAEDGAATCWPGHRLWPLDKLWRGWTEEEDNEVLQRHLLCSLKGSSSLVLNTH